jgi:hypothetical protein
MRDFQQRANARNATGRRVGVVSVDVKVVCGHAPRAVIDDGSALLVPVLDSGSSRRLAR